MRAGLGGLVVLSGLMAGAGSIAAPSLPEGFVALRDVAPGIVEDMRYATANNFTGRRVPGYEAGRCWLLKSVAEAMARVAKIAERDGLQIVVHDCYRPTRATAAFVSWAQDLTDQATKPAFYPAVAKNALFAQGYISRYSSHSTGSAVDLSLRRADGGPMDFGTPYDYFDARSTTAASVSTVARANRMKLKSMMEAIGFRNYAREWWHYGYPAQGAAAHDVPVTE